MGYTQTKINLPVKEECNALYTCTIHSGNKTLIHKVLDSSIVGSCCYGAVELKTIDDSGNLLDSMIYAGICKYRILGNGEWIYKDMDETCEPCETKCPKRILDMLTPTESKYALTWRKKCYENYVPKYNVLGNTKTKKQLKNFLANSNPTVVINFDGEKVTLNKIQYNKIKVYAGYYKNQMYRFTINQILDNFEEVIS